MLAALVILALAVLGGTVATYWYDPDAPFASRPFTGAATGLVALAGVGLVMGFVVGPVAASVVPAVAVVAAPIGLLAIPRFGAAARRDLADARAMARRAAAAWPRTLLVLGGLAAIAVLTWLVFERVMLESPDGIGTGYINNLGDLPFHLQVVASFGWAGNLPPEDPTFAGAAFTYPFLVDYLSGMLVLVGASLRQAILLPNLVLGAALIGVLVRFAGTITRDRIAAWLTPALVLLGGGLGWVMLFNDARTGSSGLVGALLAPSHDFTILSDSVWRWGNAITTLLVTQRSLLLGLPLTVVALTLFWLALAPATTPEVRRQRVIRLAVAGVATGGLVLGHTHSFVVLLGTGFLLGLLFAEWRDGRWRGWVVYLAAVAAVAVPSALLLVADSSANAGTFFGIEIGWDRGSTDPITFWLLNTGLFMPLLGVALLAGRVPWGAGPPLVDGRLLRFWLPFVAWFVIPNVVKLAPWTWDNIKVLFYWWVGSAPLVALAIAAVWRGRWRSLPRPAGRVIAAGGAGGTPPFREPRPGARRERPDHVRTVRRRRGGLRRAHPGDGPAGRPRPSRADVEPAGVPDRPPLAAGLPGLDLGPWPPVRGPRARHRADVHGRPRRARAHARTGRRVRRGDADRAGHAQGRRGDVCRLPSGRRGRRLPALPGPPVSRGRARRDARRRPAGRSGGRTRGAGASRGARASRGTRRTRGAERDPRARWSAAA